MLMRLRYESACGLLRLLIDAAALRQTVAPVA